MKNHAIRTPKKISRGRMFSILRAPHTTEKTAMLAENNYVTFKVASDATKHEIKQAVEGVFEVKVETVKVVNQKPSVRTFRGRRGMGTGFKKAYVRLQEGYNIESILGAS